MHHTPAMLILPPISTWWATALTHTTNLDGLQPLLVQSYHIPGVQQPLIIPPGLMSYSPYSYHKPDVLQPLLIPPSLMGYSPYSYPQA